MNPIELFLRIMVVIAIVLTIAVVEMVALSIAETIREANKEKEDK